LLPHQWNICEQLNFDHELICYIMP
jgi:hypothetical protein